MKQSDLKYYSESVKNIYDYGCYFMDILYVGLKREPTLEEIMKYYFMFKSKGYIDADCYVKNPCAMLKELTGNDFRMEKSSVINKKASIVIGYWFNVSTGYHHFVLMNKNNEVVWDSIYNSNTVKNGVIESYRLFYLM